MNPDLSPTAILKAARLRLEWLRDEYGEDDIDYLTFRPVVELAVYLMEVDEPVEPA